MTTVAVAQKRLSVESLLYIFVRVQRKVHQGCRIAYSIKNITIMPFLDYTHYFGIRGIASTVASITLVASTEEQSKSRATTFFLYRRRFLENEAQLDQHRYLSYYLIFSYFGCLFRADMNVISTF